VFSFQATQASTLQAAWDESLVVTGDNPAQVEDVEDDLARELAFYNQV
jgi:rRNA-processing protein EBP2